MLQKNKKTQYSILIPPISKPFTQFTVEDAKVFFDWYLSAIPERIDYLAEHTNIELNFSTHSLEELWKWFIQEAKVVQTSSSGTEYLLTHRHTRFSDSISSSMRQQLSLETEYVIRDIAMYIGKMFTYNHQNITWTYHTDIEKDSFANMPILQGFVEKNFTPNFYPTFEPNHMVRIQAFRLLRGNANFRDLVNLYCKWEEKI